MVSAGNFRGDMAEGRTDDTKDDESGNGDDFDSRINELCFAVPTDTEQVDDNGDDKEDSDPHSGRNGLVFIPILYC